VQGRKEGGNPITFKKFIDLIIKRGRGEVQAAGDTNTTKTLGKSLNSEMSIINSNNRPIKRRGASHYSLWVQVKKAKAIRTLLEKTNVFGENVSPATGGVGFGGGGVVGWLGGGGGGGWVGGGGGGGGGCVGGDSSGNRSEESSQARISRRQSDYWELISLL